MFSCWWSIIIYPSSTAMKTQNLTYFVVTILTFWGHATSSVTWPLDSAYVVFYRWSIVTMHLTCTVTEIFIISMCKHSLHFSQYVIIITLLIVNYMTKILELLNIFQVHIIHLKARKYMIYNLSSIFWWEYHTNSFVSITQHINFICTFSQQINQILHSYKI